MSEEILKALMQLFALIIKQDGGVEDNEKDFVKQFLNQQLSSDKVAFYYSLFEEHAGLVNDDSAGDEVKLTSVLDSVRVLGICKKINKTLHQNQKIVVLVRLFELVTAAKKFTPQRLAIIETVADVFKITRDEKSSIEKFVTTSVPSEYKNEHILVVDDLEKPYGKTIHLLTEKLEGHIVFLYVPSVGLYFLRYAGGGDLFLNGLPVSSRRIYLFANGSTVKLPKGKPLYYSDVVSNFLHDLSVEEISFNVVDLCYNFRSGEYGLRNISFSEEQGKLVGIMGASGSGKTTLLNNLSGIINPSTGTVKINGIDLHRDKEQLHGVIGLIPQDDLLIEELTVFQNLFYNARLCFSDKSGEEIRDRVDKTLSSLGLLDIKNLRVGNPFNKLISGGQRKRLNIALELIREPSILFVDEPTSGLSSRDSENVMDLLRELSIKGKLVFVVIHQPSSDIYKMFDQIIFMDIGGYMIYYGNPVEAVMYFKEMDAQINSEIGECPACGNVNSELIFNIIEARAVDEFGYYTNTRKVAPETWECLYMKNLEPEVIPTTDRPPPGKLKIPGWFSQMKIFLTRDFLSKVSNRQYVALTLLEAPILALLLSYIIRYIADPLSRVYIFRENENIPVYIFMSLIVALFLGLIVSAEEIFRDRKILKREAFLNLSRSGYLSSKVLILILISAIQAFLFVIIGNPVLGIKGMTFAYWLALFSTSVCANILGLNVSASFNSAITIYIVIPMLMIPMMVLSGAMFPYDKLNRKISSVDKVPWIAEIMIPKWSYEALMVHQFKNNQFNKRFYEVRKTESVANFNQVYRLPELRSRLELVKQEFESTGSIVDQVNNLDLLRVEMQKSNMVIPTHPFLETADLEPGRISAGLLERLEIQLEVLDDYYARDFVFANTQRENMIQYYMENEPELYNKVKDDYHNESVEEYVRKVFESNEIVQYRNELVQQNEPIYNDPLPGEWLSFRSHFFAPRKFFLGRYIDTFWFNMGFIWFLSLVFYVMLYYNIIYKLIHLRLK